MFYCSLIAHVPGNFAKIYTQHFAIAVAQLPPPITANFILSAIFIEFNQKYLKVPFMQIKVTS
jgi:hypothetical protein